MSIWVFFDSNIWSDVTSRWRSNDKRGLFSVQAMTCGNATSRAAMYKLQTNQSLSVLAEAQAYSPSAYYSYTPTALVKNLFTVQRGFFTGDYRKNSNVSTTDFDMAQPTDLSGRWALITVTYAVGGEASVFANGQKMLTAEENWLSGASRPWTALAPGTFSLLLGDSVSIRTTSSNTYSVIEGARLPRASSCLPERSRAITLLHRCWRRPAALRATSAYQSRLVPLLLAASRRAQGLSRACSSTTAR